MLLIEKTKNCLTLNWSISLFNIDWLFFCVKIGSFFVFILFDVDFFFKLGAYMSI